MAKEKPGTRYCERCKQVLKESSFYLSNNKEKYPDGYTNVCKKCLTAHIDNWDADTYLPVLEDLDVPYVPDEWNKILTKVSHSQQSLTGMTVIGRYLSMMKLSQYKGCTWKDTEFLKKKKEKEIQEKMTEQGYTKEEINEVITTTTLRPPPPPKPEIMQIVEESTEANPAPVDYFSATLGFEVENEMVNSLTEDDKKELCLKWGKSYRPDEWIRLEQLYSEMMESYDIQTAGHKDTLKLVCKTSLKANQLLDIGDKIYVPLKLS